MDLSDFDLPYNSLVGVFEDINLEILLTLKSWFYFCLEIILQRIFISHIQSV